MGKIRKPEDGISIHLREMENIRRKLQGLPPLPYVEKRQAKRKSTAPFTDLLKVMTTEDLDEITDSRPAVDARESTDVETDRVMQALRALAKKHYGAKVKTKKQ